MKKTISIILLCILLLQSKANANKKLETSSGVIKTLYSTLEGCSVKCNSTTKVKAAKEPTKTFKRHIRTKRKKAPSNSSFKSYMDARSIKNRQTEQYKLKARYELDESGIYKVDGRYCVAVGSYYSTKIGTKLDVVLDSGNTLNCILADCKADAHTDNTNQQHKIDGSVIEFVVHTPSLHRKSRIMGDCSWIDGFSGDVKEIIIIEED